MEQWVHSAARITHKHTEPHTPCTPYQRCTDGTQTPAFVTVSWVWLSTAGW